MTPVNEEGVVPILRKAKADGTPVVLEGNPAKGMTTLFAICDYDAGFKAGDAVGRILYLEVYLKQELWMLDCHYYPQLF